MRLLVTGFGPFPTMPRNPSAALARAVAAASCWRVRGIRTEARILTTAYTSLRQELDPALAAAPDAVLLIGVAGRSKRIRVERRATRRRSILFPDVFGEAAERTEMRGQPRERRSALPPVAALRALRRLGVPARISHDAGRYLCNAAYFRALAGPAPALFIHIPKPAPLRPGERRKRRIGREAALRSALVEIAGRLLVRARVAARARLR